MMSIAKSRRKGCRKGVRPLLRGTRPSGAAHKRGLTPFLTPDPQKRPDPFSDPRKRGLTPFLTVLLVCGLVLSGGCSGTAGDAPVAEHFVPEHWPADLVDAADKLRDRAAALSETGLDDVAIEKRSPTIVLSELRDIVGWVPEIAADTDLTEEQWIPIHVASESLSRRLRQGGAKLDPATLAELDRYCELLRERANLLGDDIAGDAPPSDSEPDSEPTVDGEEPTVESELVDPIGEGSR